MNAPQTALRDTLVKFLGKTMIEAEMFLRTNLFKVSDSNANGTVTKRYYAGRNPSSFIKNAQVVCQTFDMILASPQNQAEYDNLKMLLKNYNNDLVHFSIVGLRSEINEREWVDGDNKLNYKIDWLPGELTYFTENCLGTILIRCPFHDFT